MSRHSHRAPAWDPRVTGAGAPPEPPGGAPLRHRRAPPRAWPSRPSRFRASRSTSRGESRAVARARWRSANAFSATWSPRARPRRPRTSTCSRPSPSRSHRWARRTPSWDSRAAHRTSPRRRASSSTRSSSRRNATREAPGTSRWLTHTRETPAWRRNGSGGRLTSGWWTSSTSCPCAGRNG